MSVKRLSLQAFLSSARAALRASSPTQTNKPFALVVGNESAGAYLIENSHTLANSILNLYPDLDSICCAVVYAYLRTSTPPYTLHVPISNLTSQDLSLRPELKPVLLRANVQPSDLLTLSDLPWLGDVEATKLVARDARVVLVDHNALTGLLANAFSQQVVGCIDHHDEENAVPKDVNGEPRIVEKSGSCMSLVVAHCQKAWDELHGSEEGVALAHIAMAPILIDTNCLKDESKTKEVDRKSSTTLEALLQASGYERQAYFDEVTEAKQDIDSLSLGDVLRKDYKMWAEQDMKLGISAVVKSLDFLVQKAGSQKDLEAGLKKFAEDRALDVHSVMTTSSPDGNFRRELLVWGLNDKGAKAVEKFERDESGHLGLRAVSGILPEQVTSGYRRSWNQERLDASRKQVAPMLRKAMNDS